MDEKMTEQQTCDSTVDIDTVRIGYQIATDLRLSRSDETWSQFNAFVTANSIIVAAETLTASMQNLNTLISLVVPIFGIAVCLIWLVAHVRGMGFAVFYLLVAREIEEKYLRGDINIYSRGGDFSDGKPITLDIGGQKLTYRLNLLGRIFRGRPIAYLVILIFVSIHLVFLFLSI